MKDNKLSKIEKFILWLLLKRRSVASNFSITNFEEIRQRYDVSDINSAWGSLKIKGFVTGESNGGGFGSATAYKNVKKVFCCRFLFYKISQGIKVAWVFLWKHFLLTIILALFTSLIANSLVTNYLLKNIGL